MTPIRLFALACVVGLSLVTAAAQEAPRFLVEVSVGGTLVAKPELRVSLGGEGRLSLDKQPNDLQVRFTPTPRGDDIRLAFTITSRGEEARPTLLISRAVPGIVEWTSTADGQKIRIVISRIH
jgi:hypothetical protein